MIEDIIKFKPKKINIGDSDDQALERAIELSKKEIEGNANNVDNLNDNNANFEFEEPAINNNEMNLIEQDELKSILELSMNDYISDIEKSIPVEP
jgi:hypothetical protein